MKTYRIAYLDEDGYEYDTEECITKDEALENAKTWVDSEEAPAAVVIETHNGVDSVCVDYFGDRKAILVFLEKFTLIELDE